MALITYADKDSGAPKGSPAREWTAENANEVKAVVNANGSGGGGGGDVTGPASSVDEEITVFSGLTGKIIKGIGTTWTALISVINGKQAALGYTPENVVNKDVTGGYAGLTLFKINFKNVANTFISFFTNANTAARTYTFLDRDGTIRDWYVNKLKGANNRYHQYNDNISASTTGALTINVIRTVDFDVEFPCTLADLVVEITTGTSGNERIGVWADDGTGYPGLLLYDSGDIAITAPAVKTVSPGLLLTPGKYHKGYITDTANTHRAIGAISLKANIGYPSTLGVNTMGVCWSASQAYGSLGTVGVSSFPAGASIITIATLNNFPIIATRMT